MKTITNYYAFIQWIQNGPDNEFEDIILDE